MPLVLKHSVLLDIYLVIRNLSIMNSINMVINSLNFKLERIIQLKGVLFCFVLLSAMPHSTQIFVPQPGTEGLGMQSLNHWTIREVPKIL